MENKSPADLEGKKIGGYTLQLSEIKKGRFPGESTFAIFLKNLEISSQPAAAIRYFAGTRHIKPWMEMSYIETVKIGETAVELSKNELDITFFQLLSELIPAGGHIMVKYLDHPVTAMALNAGVPPAATPLGYLLWKSGFRWFKDWYFPEGGLEGELKLQANKPLNEEVKKAREKDIAIELRDFLNQSTAETEHEKTSRKIAQKLLKEIES